MARRLRFSQRKVSETVEDEQWIVSYADMISAILAVLLLMFSFTKIDLNVIDQLQNAISKDNKVASLVELSSKINQEAKKNGLEKDLKVVLDVDGLKLHFLNVAWFDSGKSKIRANEIERYTPIFKVIVEASKNRLIDIEGHTDDVLAKVAKPTFNWELSSDRALALFTYLSNLGINDRDVRLVAYADTKPMKKIDGLTGEALQEARAMNRRVSIFIGEVRN